jgi:glycosyltransferase involved in cell wall biosynthesis
MRGPIIKELIRRGYSVLCLAPKDNTVSGEGAAAVESLGAETLAIPMAAATISPLKDLKMLAVIFRIVRTFNPNVMLTYTIKPNIFGILAAKAALGRPLRVVAIMNGLGYTFLKNEGFRGKCIRWVTQQLYRLSFRFASTVFFHNRDDLDTFLRFGMIKRAQAQLVPGSGVDTSFYTPSELPESQTIFLLIARLIAEKGVREYAKAARIVKKTHPRYRFAILGPFYDSPSAITPQEIESWTSQGWIEYWGHAADVRTALQACSVVVLPSYREGLSRVLLEGLASGRPLIASDVPGCRELVVPGFNGQLVTPKSAEALADACLTVTSDPVQLKMFAANSRELAVTKFDHSITMSQIIAKMTNEPDKNLVPASLSDLPV